MQAHCARAVELGLPSVAFTEHLDLTPWYVPPEALHMFPREGARYLDETSTFHAPAVDFTAYFESVDRCRTALPGLRILTGLEIGEPHWFPAEVSELLGSGRFERILGSLHSARVDGRPRAIDEWFHTDQLEGATEGEAVRDYLAEAVAMIEADDHFEVFAHIDYLVRQIAAAGRQHDPRAFEAEYRETLGATGPLRPRAGAQHAPAARPPHRTLVARGRRPGRLLRLRRALRGQGRATASLRRWPWRRLPGSVAGLTASTSGAARAPRPKTQPCAGLTAYICY